MSDFHGDHPARAAVYAFHFQGQGEQSHFWFCDSIQIDQWRDHQNIFLS